MAKLQYQDNQISPALNLSLMADSSYVSGVFVFVSCIVCFSSVCCGSILGVGFETSVAVCFMVPLVVCIVGLPSVPCSSFDLRLVGVPDSVVLSRYCGHLGLPYFVTGMDSIVGILVVAVPVEPLSCWFVCFGCSSTYCLHSME